MRPIVLRSASFALLLIIASHAPVARADETRDQSRAAFRKGVAAAKENNYAAARDFFIDAYKLFPHPSILLNLGIAHSKTGELVEAEQELVKFIADDGGATTDEVKSAQRTLSEVRDKLGTIALEVKPATAKVTLDGKPVTLLSNQTTPIRGIGGRHTLRIEADGHKPYEQPIEIVTKIEIPLKVDLVPVAGAGSPLGTSPPPETGSSGGGGSGRTIVGWSLVGLGVVSGGAAAYFGLSTMSRKKDWDGQRAGVADEQIRTEGRRNALIADIAGGVAIVSVGVGAFLLLTKPKAATTTPQAGVFVAPSFAGVRGRF